jgi:hypothetical protein
VTALPLTWNRKLLLCATLRAEPNSSIRPVRPFFSTSPLTAPFSGYSSRPQLGGRLPVARPSVGPSLPPLHLAFKQSTPSLSSGTLALDTQSSRAVLLFISLPPSSSLSSFRPTSTALPGVRSPSLFGFLYPLSFGTTLLNHAQGALPTRDTLMKSMAVSMLDTTSIKLPAEFLSCARAGRW